MHFQSQMTLTASMDAAWVEQEWQIRGDPNLGVYHFWNCQRNPGIVQHV